MKRGLAIAAPSRPARSPTSEDGGECDLGDRGGGGPPCCNSRRSVCRRESCPVAITINSETLASCGIGEIKVACSMAQWLKAAALLLLEQDLGHHPFVLVI